jgi:hypothetical protein
MRRFEQRAISKASESQDVACTKTMLSVMTAAATAAIGIVAAAYTSIPPDSNSRSIYAAELQQDFISKRVANTRVRVEGEENRQLHLHAPWLNRAVANALIKRDIGSKAEKYGIETLVFEGRRLRLTYSIKRGAFQDMQIASSSTYSRLGH